MDDRVLIFDTTLRDGEQSAGVGMTVEEKVEIARQLERLNVDVIEAGFPISSPGDFEAVQTIAREVRKPVIAALAHANAKAVERAAEALKDAAHPRIHVFISSSDQHIQHQLRKNREEVVEMAAKNVALARKHTDDVEFSPMDSSRTEKEFLAHMVRATVAAGATTINIPDTVGYAIPEEFAALITYLREQVPELGDTVRLSVHCHDDLGMSVANSLAAVKAGARQVEGCINGLGERAGNAALEEVIMALRTRPDYFGVDTQIETKQLYATSRLISQVSGFAVQPNKAVIGRNAFRHASGIHQDGLLKERTTWKKSRRVRRAMTTSSKAAFPARSPIPLMHPSTCRMPALTAARLLATAIPRSLWQWTLRVTLSTLGTLALMPSSSSVNSAGLV